MCVVDGEVCEVGKDECSSVCVCVVRGGIFGAEEGEVCQIRAFDEVYLSISGLGLGLGGTAEGGHRHPHLLPERELALNERCTKLHDVLPLFDG